MVEVAEGLSQMERLPQAVLDNTCDLAIGEIKVDRDNAKQLIDTYGTYGLLYNWFPDEAIRIWDITRKPRTEFFAIAHQKLQFLLTQRWFPYEQTLFILLHAMHEKWKVVKEKLDGLTDDGTNRETLHGAMEQIERCERALKMHWRERHRDEENWSEQYRKLDRRSEEIRRAALTVLSQHLVRGQVPRKPFKATTRKRK